MSEEVVQRLVDFFEPSDFADYLGVSVRDLVEAFPEKLEAVLDELEELMQVKHS